MTNQDLWQTYCLFAGYLVALVFALIFLAIMYLGFAHIARCKFLKKKQPKQVKKSSPISSSELDEIFKQYMNLPEQNESFMRNDVLDKELAKITANLTPLNPCINTGCENVIGPAMRFTGAFVLVECMNCGKESNAFLEDDLGGAIIEWNNSNPKE